MSDKRDKLESTAIDEVQRTGLTNLSFRTLADMVGVKSSSVHYYFPEKSDLADAILRKYLAGFKEQLEVIAARRTTPRKKIDAFIDIFHDTLKDEKFCLCGMMAAEIDVLSDDGRQLLDDFFVGAEEWLAQLLGSDDIELAIDMAPSALARVILSGLEGAILLDRVDEKHRRVKAQRDFVKSVIS